MLSFTNFYCLSNNNNSVYRILLILDQEVFPRFPLYTKNITCWKLNDFTGNTFRIRDCKCQNFDDDETVTFTELISFGRNLNFLNSLDVKDMFHLFRVFHFLFTHFYKRRKCLLCLIKVLKKTDFSFGWNKALCFRSVMVIIS